MAKFEKSASLYERAKRVMPGGCSRNTILRKPHPIYAAKGEGCYVTDIEGVKRIDFANNVASLIHGHANPEMLAGVQARMALGTAFSVGTEIEVEYAEQIVSRSSNFDMIRFVNSGTEAVMNCIKAARAFTGRPKIAKVEGAYHGLYDFAEVSQTASPATWGDRNTPASVPVSRGTPQSVLNDVVVIPFNDPDTSVSILNGHKDAIAGILVDLLPHRIGVIPAEQNYVRALRKWATENGALLIIDEVITFRSDFSGAQDAYGIKTDLTALGKIIGGGFPVGAIAGTAEVMDVMNPLNGPAPLPLYGTFSANPITLAAGSIAMKLFDQAAVVKLNALSEKARAGMADAIKIADVPACVTGRGSMFRIHLKENPPRNYREAFVASEEQKRLSALLDHLFRNGLLMVETCTGFLSTPMGQTEVDHLCETVLDGLRKIKPLM